MSKLYLSHFVILNAFILTSFDIKVALLLREYLDIRRIFMSDKTSHSIKPLSASEIMRTNLISVKLLDDLSYAYQKMQQEGVRHLPVLDEDGKIVGIISDRDFQRAMWPTVKTRGGRSDNTTLRPGSIVANYMSWPVVTFSHDTDLETVVRAMIDDKISAVLITEQSELTGIITHEDLLVVLAVLLKKPTSLKDKIVEWTYKSPIGQVVSMLANSGI
jgi:CBS domain-containing protein